MGTREFMVSHLLNFLLSNADHFPNGDERRLFYVALTDARKPVHILSRDEQPSKFVEEIEANEIFGKSEKIIS